MCILLIMVKNASFAQNAAYWRQPLQSFKNALISTKVRDVSSAAERLLEQWRNLHDHITCKSKRTRTDTLAHLRVHNHRVQSIRTVSTVHQLHAT